MIFQQEKPNQANGWLAWISFWCVDDFAEDEDQWHQGQTRGEPSGERWKQLPKKRLEDANICQWRGPQ